jgi:predicted nuclease of predicted toxin-antitoxin system
MRILLDESLPRRLRSSFPGHEVATVAEAGWSSLTNGELLQLAASHFDLSLPRIRTFSISII